MKRDPRFSEGRVLNVLPETLKKQLQCTAEYRTNAILEEKAMPCPKSQPARPVSRRGSRPTL